MQGKRQSSHAKFLKTPTSLSLKGTGSEGARDIDPYFHQEEKTAIDCKCRSTGNKEVAKQKRLEGLAQERLSLCPVTRKAALRSQHHQAGLFSQ